MLLPVAQAILAAGILLALAFWLGRPLARATVWITQRSGQRSTLLVVVSAALLLTAAGARSSIALDTLDVGTAAGRSTMTLTVALLGAALVGKLLAPLVLRDREEPTWVIGSALVPREEVGLVFAQIGLRQGVLTTEQFSALAVVIGATTFAGPLGLRRLWP